MRKSEKWGQTAQIMDVCNSASKEQKANKDKAIALSVRGRIPLNISGLTVEILIFGGNSNLDLLPGCAHINVI